MDQYQNNNIATLYILNQECMMLIIEKSKHRDVAIVDVIRYPYKPCLCIFWHCHPYFILQFYSIVFYTCIYNVILTSKTVKGNVFRVKAIRTANI